MGTSYKNKYYINDNELFDMALTFSLIIFKLKIRTRRQVTGFYITFINNRS